MQSVVLIFELTKFEIRNSKLTKVHEPILISSIFRFINEQEIVESEEIVTEFNAKESVYTLTLTGNLKEKSGKVKILAKNNGGEVTSEAELIISGSSPEFEMKPIKCTVLEGRVALSMLRIIYSSLLFNNRCRTMLTLLEFLSCIPTSLQPTNFLISSMSS